MLGALCVCALVPAPPLPTRVRLALIIHRYEARKPTNTGQLAARCLADSEVIVRGRDDRPDPPFVAAPGTRPLLLFPAPDATALAPSDEPVTLIVPDGTWHQAARVRNRVPGLRAVPCVTLPPGPPSRYRLRTEPRADGLATIEAIARALTILGEPEAAAALERVFVAVVERTLWARGALPAEAVAGLPPGLARHALFRAPDGG